MQRAELWKGWSVSYHRYTCCIFLEICTEGRLWVDFGRSRFCPASHAHAAKAVIRGGSHNSKTRRSVLFVRCRW